MASLSGKATIRQSRAGETRLEIGCETAGDVKRVVFIDVEDQRQSRQMLDRVWRKRGMAWRAQKARRDRPRR
jgi:hypothetical protein